jgi:hypothetical protein
VIRLRFVATLAAFVLLLAGYATYAAYTRPAPTFDGATDAAHVAAVKALIAAIATPAGSTLDPYGTRCDAASTSCWTSTSLEPTTLISEISGTLVARGAKPRSHECLKADATSVQTPDGNSGCTAVLDFRGSRIELTSSRSPIADNGGGTWLRLDSPAVTPAANRWQASAFGAWETVSPLPAAWTSGVTCTTSTNEGCRQYDQSASTSPAISAPVSQVCATIRSTMRGRYFFVLDNDRPATASRGASCTLVGHRYRSLGSHDGEYLDVVATSTGPSSTTLTVGLVVGS